MFGGGTISWSSKKHYCVAMSIMDEYIPSCVAIKETVWLKWFLQILSVVTSVAEPVKLLCDKIATISFAKDPKFHVGQSILTSNIILFGLWQKEKRLSFYIFRLDRCWLTGWRNILSVIFSLHILGVWDYTHNHIYFSILIRYPCTCRRYNIFLYSVVIH